MDDGGLCESCATVLPAPDAEGIIVCPSCGRVDRSVADERERRAHAEALAEAEAEAEAERGPAIQSAVTIDLSDLDIDTEAVTSAAATTAKVGCIIPIVILVVIGIVIAGVIKSVADETGSIAKIFDSGSGDLLPLAGTASLATTDAEGVTDLVLVGQDSGASKRMLVRLTMGPDGADEVWRSDPLPKDAYNLTMVRSGDRVYAAVNDEVRALSYATGKAVWTATLTDKVQNVCPDCLAVVGDKVLVRTQDAQLTMFGPTSSEPLWSKRLNSAQGTASVVDGRVFVVDDPAPKAGGEPAVVSTVDPATGKVLKTFTPLCAGPASQPWEASLDAGDRIRQVTGTKDVVAAFGFGTACVMRWDPATNAVRWRLSITGIGSIDDTKASVQGRYLLIPESSAIVRVDLTSGKGVQLAEIPDAQAAKPPVLIGSTVVAGTSSTRGSTRGGLAGWDIVSGKLLWSTTLPGESEMMDTDENRSSTTLFPGRTGVVVIPAGEGARLVTFAEESLMTVQSLALRTGDLGPPDKRSYDRRYESGTVSITLEDAQPNAVIVSPDNFLQRIPLVGSGDIVTYG